MAYIYVCSPYSPTPPAPSNPVICAEIMESNYKRVENYMAEMVRIENNVVRYSPIMHWHNAATLYNLGKANADWILHNRTMIRNSGRVEVLRLEGWEKSVGVQQEIAWAAEFGKEVRLVETQL